MIVLIFCQTGPDQPDEDDYGYTSKEASEYYTKLMNKYSNAPAEDPKFSKKQKTTVKSVKQMTETKVRAPVHTIVTVHNYSNTVKNLLKSSG